MVQRQCPSRTDRILVDVAGYRERRSAALKRFSVQIAEEVLASGQEKALEAMSPADRKSVHDAINEMPGVVTRSEGEDPNRHIVIAPGGLTQRRCPAPRSTGKIAPPPSPRLRRWATFSPTPAGQASSVPVPSSPSYSTPRALPP